MDVLSAETIIAQSDMKYLMKINLEHFMSQAMDFWQRPYLLLEFGKKWFFCKTSFFKSLLAFITFVNYESSRNLPAQEHISDLIIVFLLLTLNMQSLAGNMFALSLFIFQCCASAIVSYHKSKKEVCAVAVNINKESKK